MSSLNSKLQGLSKGTVTHHKFSDGVGENLQKLSKKSTSSILTEGPTEGNSKNMSNLDKVVTKNKDAIKLAAKLEVGNTAANILSNKIKKQMPLMMQGYAEHPLFKVAIGNAAAAAITHFAPNNKKANLVGDAMIAASMQQFVQSFDMPSLIEELVSGVNLASLVEAE
jgi:hypothetical protein